LYQFLLPFRDYLCGKHGLAWTDNMLKFPYSDLVRILAEPDDEMPELLKTGLFFIDELSNPKGTELLLYQLHEDGIPTNGSIAQEDIALFSWLHDSRILQSAHPELAALRSKRFEKYYYAYPVCPDLSRECLIAMEDALNDWFDSHRKGRGVQVMVYERCGTILLHLRHGELLKHDTALQNNGMTKRIVYRPERYGRLELMLSDCVLNVHSNSKQENIIYRRMFGKYCCKNENLFFSESGDNLFTLDPLRDRGRDALICRDIDGLEWARLKELQTLILTKGGKEYHEIFKSEHCLFDDWEKTGRKYKDSAQFTRATFLIQVTGLARARSLTISLPGTTIYDRGREIDRLFGLWMKHRHFTIK
jgi:hypothetical protein